MGLLQMGWRRRLQTVSNEKCKENAAGGQDADDGGRDAERRGRVGLGLR